MRDDNVIDFFKKTLTDDTMPRRFFKGFQYLKITKDENGNYFNENALRSYAEKCFYIVTIMKKNGIGAALYKYKVPYGELLNFFTVFKNNKSYGEIIDIERYVPNDSA